MRYSRVKKWLTVTLALSMTFGMAPTAVFAEESVVVDEVVEAEAAPAETAEEAYVEETAEEIELSEITELPAEETAENVSSEIVAEEASEDDVPEAAVEEEQVEVLAADAEDDFLRFLMILHWKKQNWPEQRQKRSFPAMS